MNPFRTVRAALIAAAIAIAAIVVGFHLFNLLRNARTEARVAQSQAGAVSQSATDAINVVGTSSAAERVSDEQSADSERTIQATEGANVPVATPVRDAGLAALCRRAAYRESPRCVR